MRSVTDQIYPGLDERRTIMARTPDGGRAREFMVTARMSAEDRQLLDAGRQARGDGSNSTYLRRLVREDAARLKRRPTKGNG